MKIIAYIFAVFSLVMVVSAATSGFNHHHVSVASRNAELRREHRVTCERICKNHHGLDYMAKSPGGLLCICNGGISLPGSVY